MRSFWKDWNNFVKIQCYLKGGSCLVFDSIELTIRKRNEMFGREERKSTKGWKMSSCLLCHECECLKKTTKVTKSNRFEYWLNWYQNLMESIKKVDLDLIIVFQQTKNEDYRPRATFSCRAAWSWTTSWALSSAL